MWTQNAKDFEFFLLCYDLRHPQLFISPRLPGSDTQQSDIDDSMFDMCVHKHTKSSKLLPRRTLEPVSIWTLQVESG